MLNNTVLWCKQKNQRLDFRRYGRPPTCPTMHPFTHPHQAWGIKMSQSANPGLKELTFLWERQTISSKQVNQNNTLRWVPWREQIGCGAPLGTEWPREGSSSVRAGIGPRPQSKQKETQVLPRACSYGKGGVNLDGTQWAKASVPATCREKQQVWERPSRELRPSQESGSYPKQSVQSYWEFLSRWVMHAALHFLKTTLPAGGK